MFSSQVFCTGSAWQITCEVINLIQAPKNIIFANFSFISSTIDLQICQNTKIPKYQIVHLEYFDGTLPILQNFEKTI